MQTSYEVFMEIVSKYNLPTPVENVEGKTVDYVIDGYDIHVIVFTDNTCYFLWTNTMEEGIRTEDCYDDIFEEFEGWVFDAFQYNFPEAKKEWNVFMNELRKQDDEKKREYRYKEYLKLKAEFEGK